MTQTADALHTWAADPTHSEIGFVARHMVVTKVRGNFRTFDVTLQIPENAIVPSAIEATIDAASIDTRIADRDNHLRSADFFDVQNYPSLRFRSERITAHGANDFEVAGELTMHGIAKTVTFTTHGERLGKDPWGNERLGYSAELRLNREEFGLTWNQALETGGVIVSKEIEIQLELQVLPKA